jgi:L-2-hydroxyglutarate oxidase LhgO
MKILIILFSIFYPTYAQQPKKIAIIGSGISGINAARLLLKNENNFKIDMYESSEQIGGRIQSTQFNNTNFNIGAILNVKEQRLLNSLIEEYKIEREKFVNSDSSGPFGIINNNTMTFEMGMSNIYNVMKLVWRYGMSPLSFKMTLDKFEKKIEAIYDRLEKKIAINTIEEVVGILEAKNLVNKSITDYVKEINLNEKYVNEIVKGAMLGIYNQDDMSVLSAFLTLVKLDKELFYIKGGNKQLVEAMMDTCMNSKNFKLFLNIDINSISKKEQAGIYTIKSKNETKEYDLVILAAPLSVTNINFTENLEYVNKFKKSPKATKMQITYIQGEFNTETFKRSTFPRKILIPETPITSAKINGIINFNGIYRLHSRMPIVESELEEENIFKKGFKVLKTHTWSYAFGKFEPIMSFIEIPGYRLDTRLFYTNAHEVITTSMESALASAVNVVNMIEEMYMIEKKDVKKDVKEDI